MIVAAWRIVPREHQATAFTGDGSRLFAGRWNSRGAAIVYTASNVSLAILEILVHLREATTLPDYRLIQAEFDDSLLMTLDKALLPDDWRHDPAPKVLKRFGDEWLHSARSVALAVPSAVTGEPNYLLNPSHPRFPEVEIGPPQRLLLDPRLVPESLSAKPGRRRKR